MKNTKGKQIRFRVNWIKQGDKRIQDFSWGLCKVVNFNCFDYQ